MNAGFISRPLLVVALAIVGQGPCSAQLFGRPRQLGQPLARQARVGNLEDVGQITGTERFLRENRGRAEFVGADQTEKQGFVGSQQARTSGVIVSSTAGIDPPPDRSSQINRPLRPARTGEMYLPKVVLSDDLAIDSSLRSPNRDVSLRVQRAAQLASKLPIEVLVQARTATLRGWVESEYERELAETLVLFEPGISEVVNQLRVQDAPVPPAPEPHPPLDPSEGK